MLRAAMKGGIVFALGMFLMGANTKTTTAAPSTNAGCWVCQDYTTGDPLTGSYCAELSGNGEGYLDCNTHLSGSKSSCTHGFQPDCSLDNLVDLAADGSVETLAQTLSEVAALPDYGKSVGRGRLSTSSLADGSRVLRTCTGSVVARDYSASGTKSLREVTKAFDF